MLTAVKFLLRRRIFHQLARFCVCFVCMCVYAHMCVVSVDASCSKRQIKAELITFAAQACLLPVCFERSVTVKLLVEKSASKLLTETADYCG